MGRAVPDPPPEAPAQKPAQPYRPTAFNGPPPPSVQPCKRCCCCLLGFGSPTRPESDPLFTDQHENLQCFQCFITFCNAKAKERHMKKSHREEYKQQLQQVLTPPTDPPSIMCHLLETRPQWSFHLAYAVSGIKTFSGTWFLLSGRSSFEFCLNCGRGHCGATPLPSSICLHAPPH